MKKSYFYVFMLILAFIVFLTGCGQQGTNNPLGVTGGIDNIGGGSGIIGTWLYEGNIDPSLKHLEETYKTQIYLTFNSDGTYLYEDYEYNWNEDSEEWELDDQYSETGNYSVSGDQLTIMNSGGEFTNTFSISGDELTLYNDDGSYLIFIRV